MSKPWLLVSPASRGIGLQLARRLLKTTDLPVIATARKDLQSTSEQILEGLDIDKHRLEVLKLDVTGTASPAIRPAPKSQLIFSHQMKAPYQKRHPSVHLNSHPATSALPFVSPAYCIPRSPPPKSTMPKPSPLSKSIPLVPFSSQSTSRPSYPAAPRPSNLSPISLPPLSSP